VKKLPDATDLELAFKGDGGPSHGTTLTVISGLGKGGAIRKNGKNYSRFQCIRREKI
jgi:hypothetical protein